MNKRKGINNFFWRAIFIVVLISCPVVILAQEQKADVKDWEFSSYLTFESGDYGTSETTNTLYLPFTLTRFFEKAEISGTLPFIYQDVGSGVSAISGTPTRIGGSGGEANGGIGDILLSGKYRLLEEATEPFINLKGTCKIKFPTADKDKNLGTGEFDEGFGLEASKTLNEKWAVFFDMYYTFIGDPSGMALDNELAVDFGVGYQLDADNTMSVFYEERTALVDGEDNPRILSFYLGHALNDSTSVLGGLSIGLSDGSSDVALTIGVSNKF